METILKHTFRFVILILVQWLVLNQVDFQGYLDPVVYVLAIFLLPLNVPSLALMLIAFMSGLTVDMLTSSWGLNAFAAVLIGFLRPSILKLIIAPDDLAIYESPGMANIGFQKFFVYSGSLVLIYHLVVYFLDYSRIDMIGVALIRGSLSAAFSLVVILLFQSLFGRSG